MSYADWYKQHKAEWDEETSRRKIDKVLIGEKTPSEADVIKMLKQEHKEKRKNE